MMRVRKMVQHKRVGPAMAALSSSDREQLHHDCCFLQDIKPIGLFPTLGQTVSKGCDLGGGVNSHNS